MPYVRIAPILEPFILKEVGEMGRVLRLGVVPVIALVSIGGIGSGGAGTASGHAIAPRAQAAAASAVRVVTGTQNARYRVTVTITPAHPATGDTIVATARIVNRTKHRHRGTWTVTWLTPGSGISAAQYGIIKRGVVIADRETAAVTRTSPRGTYTISASIHDRRGTSHAKVSVTVK